MNQMQKNYVAKRIAEIARDLEAKSRTDCYHKGTEPLSAYDRLKMITTGKVKMKSKAAIMGRDETHRGYQGMPGVDEVFDFTPFIKKSFMDQRKHDARCVAIHVEVSRLTDEVMLGDAEEALAHLAKFEKF